MSGFAVRMEDVHKSFDGRPILRGLTLSVKRQSIYAFLGNNGEGKSTTIRLITGLLHPDRGAIEVLGMDVRRRRREVLSQVGALVDAPSFYPNLTASEFLNIARVTKDLPRVETDRVLDVVGLSSARTRMISDFSLGMKQRLAIAHALMGSPPLLVLDEPTNGLDPEGTYEVRVLLRSLPADTGCTIFVSSHNLDEIEKTATHVAVLQGGIARYEGAMDDLGATQNGLLALDVSDAALASALLRQASYEVRVAGTKHVVVGPLPYDKADQVHHLLIGGGVGLFQSVYSRPSLEQWFLTQSRTRHA